MRPGEQVKSMNVTRLEVSTSTTAEEIMPAYMTSLPAMGSRPGLCKSSRPVMTSVPSVSSFPPMMAPKKIGSFTHPDASRIPGNKDVWRRCRCALTLVVVLAAMGTLAFYAYDAILTSSPVIISSNGSDATVVEEVYSLTTRPEASWLEVTKLSGPENMLAVH
eukprot:6726673-Prymnesium_polylepis.2